MPEVNNAFYDDLGDRWFEGDDHAIALLRHESVAKVDYVRETLAEHGIGPGARVLDVGCGAGLVALPLAESGYRVDGIDMAEGAIATAQRHTPPGAPAHFSTGDAYALDADGDQYDAVLALDFLEHVDRPEDALRESARVLKPGGLLLYHTFNRTPAAAALAIYGMKLVTRDCPEHLHVYRLFIKPDELRAMLARLGFEEASFVGLRPAIDGALVRSALKRRVDPDFRFVQTRSLAVGYLGHARLEG
jgi:2-polyprenyl-6-hydroxyphenyl methylase/3-demethylubiquinone-9 3-methyltransferase